MFFASDNAGPVHPKVMAKLAEANEGHVMPYGDCPWTARAVEMVRALFEAPEAEVHLVPTGTAANGLLLGSLAAPWHRVFCTEKAHIQVDEMGAVTLHSGGAEQALVPQTDGRMMADALAARIAVEDSARRGPVTVTQVSELGTVHSLDDLAAVRDTAAAHGLPLHMDGARFANACAALGCSAARMVEGFAAVSFGGTKNGLMGVEAAVRLDPAQGETFRFRQQRAGHVFSKSRYLAAQLVAYLEDDLWPDMAKAAHANAARLAEGLRRHPDVEILHPVDANMVFARWPAALHDRLEAEGAVYYREHLAGGPTEGPEYCRLVCDWSLAPERIDRFLSVLAAG